MTEVSIGQGLPKGLTQEEKSFIQSGLYQAPIPDAPGLQLLTSPPQKPVRAMAEWEESQAVVITWTSYTSILKEIVRNIQDECNVIIVCNNPATVKTFLSNNNINPDKNIIYIQKSFNSVWVRDYGPTSVYSNRVDSMYLVDWIYNRPRPLDDVVPGHVAATLQVPLYSTTTPPLDLVHTGGNYMSDGMGFAFSSNLVLDENGPGNQYGYTIQSESDVDNIMNQFMGIQTYPKMTNLPYDGIHHIDMHMKLLDEQTLMVGKYPDGIADGPQIEANLQYILSNYTTSFGTPFKVIRIVMPPEGSNYPNTNGDYRTYTNALIVNKTILLPTYELKYDTTALRIWREAMPGYKVVGIDCNAIIPASGAIHCITHEIGVNDPLLINHQPIEDNPPVVNNGIDVKAHILHRSGIQNASIYWTYDTTEVWNKVQLFPNAQDTFLNFIGAIPYEGKTRTIYYYIHAESNSGKQQYRPMPAPKGYWKFNIKGNTTSIEEAEKNLIIDTPFPNPASAITVIPVTLPSTGYLQVELINLFGQSISLFQGNCGAGEKKIFFNAKDFLPGFYVIQYTWNDVKSYSKILVK